MRKDSFVSNQHLLILRVHSISATMDTRDSFPERGLLAFPVLCLLLCSTVSHRGDEKWLLLICDSISDGSILSRVQSCFLVLGLNIPLS